MHSFYLAVALAASSVIGLPHPHNAARGVAAKRQYSGTQSGSNNFETLFDAICTDLCEELVGDDLISQAGGEATCFKECLLQLGTELEEYLEEYITSSPYSNTHSGTYSSTPAKRQSPSVNSGFDSLEAEVAEACTDFCEELVGDGLISQAGGEATCLKECEIISDTLIEQFLDSLTPASTYSSTYSKTPAKRQSPSVNSNSNSLEEDIDAACTDLCEELVGDGLISQAGGEATCFKECQLITDTLVEEILDYETPVSTYSNTPAKRQSPSVNSNSNSLEQDIDAFCTDFCEELVGDGLISQAGGEATCFKECELIFGSLIEQYLDAPTYGSTPAYPAGSTPAYPAGSTPTYTSYRTPTAKPVASAAVSSS